MCTSFWPFYHQTLTEGANWKEMVVQRGSSVPNSSSGAIYKWPISSWEVSVFSPIFLFGGRIVICKSSIRKIDKIYTEFDKMINLIQKAYYKEL
jgi:hypothetical protein